MLHLTSWYAGYEDQVSEKRAKAPTLLKGWNSQKACCYSIKTPQKKVFVPRYHTVFIFLMFY